jgi:hypothetical protein
MITMTVDWNCICLLLLAKGLLQLEGGEGTTGNNHHARSHAMLESIGKSPMASSELLCAPAHCLYASASDLQEDSDAKQTHRRKTMKWVFDDNLRCAQVNDDATSDASH